MNPGSIVSLAILMCASVTSSLGCAHVTPPGREVYVISEDASGVGSSIGSGTGGAGAEAYCNELEKKCFKTCWRRKPSISSIPKGGGMHHVHCTETCRRIYTQCIKEQEELERQESQRKALHFSSMNAALEWLKDHKTEVAVGTVVIVAGVLAAPYVVAVVGGALVLAPL